MLLRSSGSDDKKELPPTVFSEETCTRRGFAKVPTHEPTYFHPDPAHETHEMYYEVHGDGPEKLLFIMGMKNCCFSWQRQVEHFGKDPRYTVLVLDNRGSGSSDTPRGPYTTALMARDCLTIMDSLEGWDKDRGIHVIGVSMGGMIALQLASMASFRIASLTLAVTSAGHGVRRMFPPVEGMQISTRNLLRDQMERYMLMLYPEPWLQEIDPDDPEGRTNKETRISEHLERAAMIPGQSVLGNFFQLSAATTHHVPSEDLNRINDAVPKICVLSAKNDSLIPRDASDNLCKHMKDAELVLWEDAGHAIHSQHPQRFNELIERIVTEGRDLAGPARKPRPDSLFLYPREKQAAGSYYPKSLSDLVDKLWITSKSKDGPEEDENLTTSPVDIMSDTKARLHSNGGVGSGESRKGTAGDSQPKSDSIMSHPHPLRELVERVMRDPLAKREAAGLKSSGADDTSRPQPNLADLVKAVVRRKSEHPSSSRPSQLTSPPSSPPRAVTRPSSPDLRTPPPPPAQPKPIEEPLYTPASSPSAHSSLKITPRGPGGLAASHLAPPLTVHSPRSQTLPSHFESPRSDHASASVPITPSASTSSASSLSSPPRLSRSPWVPTRQLPNIRTSPTKPLLSPPPPNNTPVNGVDSSIPTSSNAPTSPLALFTRAISGRGKSRSREPERVG